MSRFPAVALQPYQSSLHEGWYQALIDQEPHRDTDFYSVEELHELMARHEVEAWVAKGPQGLIGWCAVVLRSPHHPLPDAVHFLGSIVEAAHRGQGYGGALVVARLALYGDRPITASVLPGNVPSERMLRTQGFRPGLRQGPWCTWHRPSARHPMVLLDHPNAVEAFTRTGIYAECATPPVEGGHGRILRGLWPDAAAFHAVPLPQGEPLAP